jgi:hypothetical protein
LRDHRDQRLRVDELDAACARLRHSASQSAADRALPAYAHRAACLAPPWELPRRGAACRLVLYCRDHPVRRRCRDAAGIAKGVHRDAALAHHQDDPAARCLDDMSEGRQPGACFAAHQDELAQVPKEDRRDVMDNVATSTVRRQDVPLRARLGLQQAAAERRDAAQMIRERRQAAQRQVKLETRVQMLRASQRQALRQSRAMLDELSLCPQVRQGALRPGPSLIQLREHAPQHPA